MGILEIKNLSKWAGDRNVSITTEHKRWKRISGTKDTIEEVDSWLKENIPHKNY